MTNETLDLCEVSITEILQLNSPIISHLLVLVDIIFDPPNPDVFEGSQKKVF